MNKKYHLLYKITNVIDNSFYIGVHSTNNLDDKYFGSGIRIKRSVNKYGKENHRFEVLEYLSSRKDLLNREAEIVNEILLSDPLCLNLCKGGGSSMMNYTDTARERMSKGRKGKKHTLEARDKMRQATGKPVSDETRRKISEKNKGKKLSDEHRQKLSSGAKKREKHPWSGKQRSEESKIKMSLSHKGKISTNRKAIVVNNVEYESISNAIEKSGLSKSSIYRALKIENSGIHYI